MTRSSIVIAALAFTAAVPASNIANAQTVTARQACRADYSKLCSGTTPGGGRIVACLQSHADQLSQDCRDAIKAVKPK